MAQRLKNKTTGADVDALMWCDEDAHEVLGFLDSHEVDYSIKRDVIYLPVPEDGDVEDFRVHPCHYILRSDDGTLTAATPETIAEQYEDISA